MNMKHALYVASALTAAAWLSGCASSQSGNVNVACPALRPTVHVTYGDSYLKADAHAKVKPHCPLVFKLQPKSNGPDGLDYSKVRVTIEGKAEQNPATWISFSVTAADTPNRTVTRVTPPDQALGTYYYLVTVEKVGTLDPRVEVTK